MARLSLRLPDTLHQRLGSAPDEEVWKILDEREAAPPGADVGWTPELRHALEARIDEARKGAGRTGKAPGL